MDARLIARVTGIRERSLDTCLMRIRQYPRDAGAEDAERVAEAPPISGASVSWPYGCNRPGSAPPVGWRGSCPRVPTPRKLIKRCA
jgi:hypothetical protein